MGFVAEYISAVDMAKHRIDEINELVEISWRTYSDQWVIDHERGIYLRRIAHGREDLSTESAWSFYWNENLYWIFIELVDSSATGRNAPGWARKKVGSVRLLNDRREKLPPALLELRNEMLRDLEFALIAYKDGGVYSATTEYTLYLDVAETAFS